MNMLPRADSQSFKHEQRPGALGEFHVFLRNTCRVLATGAPDDLGLGASHLLHEAGAHRNFQQLSASRPVTQWLNDAGISQSPVWLTGRCDLWLEIRVQTVRVLLGHFRILAPVAASFRSLPNKESRPWSCADGVARDRPDAAGCRLQAVVGRPDDDAHSSVCHDCVDDRGSGLRYQRGGRCSADDLRACPCA